MRWLPCALLLHSLCCFAAEAPRSGYDFLSEPNRALQDDEFANPGMLWVELGSVLFEEGCAQCHAAAKMRGVRLRYPAFDERTGKLLGLEGRINRCREERMHAPALAWESQEMLALTAWIGFASRGLVFDVAPDARTQPFYDAGKAFYEQHRGQLDLACGHCHDRHPGDRLRGEVVSEGHINGYPAYRHVWETLGSSHRLFHWCNDAVRAEPYPAGADEYVNLEYYLEVRGRGLHVETPAVRR